MKPKPEGVLHSHTRKLRHSFPTPCLPGQSELERHLQSRGLQISQRSRRSVARGRPELFCSEVFIGGIRRASVACESLHEACLQYSTLVFGLEHGQGVNSWKDSTLRTLELGLLAASTGQQNAAHFAQHRQQLTPPTASTGLSQPRAKRTVLRLAFEQATAPWLKFQTTVQAFGSGAQGSRLGLEQGARRCLQQTQICGGSK